MNRPYPSFPLNDTVIAGCAASSLFVAGTKQGDEFTLSQACFWRKNELKMRIYNNLVWMHMGELCFYNFTLVWLRSCIMLTRAFRSHGTVQRFSMKIKGGGWPPPRRVMGWQLHLWKLLNHALCLGLFINLIACSY